MKPRARKKASAISQGISDENALKAAAKGNRPVTMETPRPIIAVAPRGRGCAVEGSWKSVSRQTLWRGKNNLPRRGGNILTETDWNWVDGSGTHVGDNADDGAHKDGEQVPSLGRDAGRGRDQPDQEARENGVPERLQLRALPFGSRSSLHRGNSGRCARANDALGERALRDGR